jgi:hypothetical protein
LYGTSLNGQLQPRKHFGILLVSSSSSLSDFFSKLENVNYDADLSQPKDLYFVFLFFFTVWWVVLDSFPFVVYFGYSVVFYNSFVNVLDRKVFYFYYFFPDYS